MFNLPPHPPHSIIFTNLLDFVTLKGSNFFFLDLMGLLLPLQVQTEKIPRQKVWSQLMLYPGLHSSQYVMTQTKMEVTCKRV